MKRSPEHLAFLHEFVIENRAQIEAIVGGNVNTASMLGFGTYGIAYKSGSDVVKVTLDETEARAAHEILGDTELKYHPGVVYVHGAWGVGAIDGRDVHVLHLERLTPFNRAVKDKYNRELIIDILGHYRSAVQDNFDDGYEIEEYVDMLSGNEYTSELADFIRLVHDRTGKWPEDIWEENLGGKDGHLAVLDLGSIGL